MPIKIGYEDVQANAGNSGQLAVINAIGATGINLSTIASLGASQVLFLEQPSYSYHGSDWNNNFSNVSTFMNNGGVLLVADSYLGGSQMQPYVPHDENGVGFINDNGPINHGPGGTLADGISFSYSGIYWVSHGYIDVDNALVQDAEYAFLMNAVDPGHAIMSMQSQGSGYGINTAIPMHLWLNGGGSSYERGVVTTITENTLAYASSLFKMGQINLSNLADNFTGTNHADDIFGNDGDDVIDGGKGSDIIHGGAGNDTISGGVGVGDEIIWGDAGNDNIKGASGNDQIWGGANDDVLSGGKGSDYIVGGSGKDNITGSVGNDFLFGTDGNDKIDGGGDNDFIEGGLGRDTLTGGAGVDTFNYSSGDSGVGAAVHDTITDFVHATDRINIHDFTGASFSGSFTGVVNQVVITSFTGGNLVQIDVNGDTVADQEIVVLTVGGVHNVDSSDFVL